MLAALLVHSAPPESSRNYRSTGVSPTLSPTDTDAPRRKRARIEPPELPLASICLNARLGDDDDERKATEGQATADDDRTKNLPLDPVKLRKGLLKAMFDVASADDTKEASRKKMYREWKEATELAEEVPSIDPISA